SFSLEKVMVVVETLVVVVASLVEKLVDGGVEEVGDLSLESMEDEEVALVDGVLEGAFGALGDVEALVDAIEVIDVEDE
nr:hypothetical protein [Tanacetum cinerariifolium]